MSTADAIKASIPLFGVPRPLVVTLKSATYLSPQSIHVCPPCSSWVVRSHLFLTPEGKLVVMMQIATESTVLRLQQERHGFQCGSARLHATTTAAACCGEIDCLRLRLGPQTEPRSRCAVPVYPLYRRIGQFTFVSLGTLI
jgi:hypothetical protein